MKQLSKEQTKELEHNSHEPYNLLFNHRDLYDMYVSQLMLLTGWIHTRNLTTSDPQKKRNDKLTELLECQPNYHVVYEYRNAVWGFQYDEDVNNTFLIYCSIRGFTLQVNDKFDIYKINDLLELLISIIVDKNGAPDFMLKYYEDTQRKIKGGLVNKVIGMIKKINK